MSTLKRPISLALAALGGQGGGVVSGWLTAVARLECYVVQATSVPGVAQRTGATLYYLEFFAESDLPGDGRRPVLALMPNPGDVDIVVATELVEAGRAMQRGLVSADRTTLIASTHRAYTISEKSSLGDGRVDSGPILLEARHLARDLVALDMAALAERHGAVISSVILGAIAGAGCLPFKIESFRQAIRDGGIAVATNLAAFDAAAESVRKRPEPAVEAQLSAGVARVPESLREQIHRRFPKAVWQTLEHGVARAVDYQDEAYGAEYLARLVPFAGIETGVDDAARLTGVVARGLALWMTIEDTIRVAQLKTRPERIAAIRKHVRAGPEQVVEVREFLKPRIEEICGTLPAGIGRWLLRSPTRRRWVAVFSGERAVRTTSIGGYLFLRGIAALRRWRRSTLRFSLENDEIVRWLDTVHRTALVDYAAAVELAECQRLVRGYGDTYERGLRNFTTILEAARPLIGRLDAAVRVARWRNAALADDQGAVLAKELAAHAYA